MLKEQPYSLIDFKEDDLDLVFGIYKSNEAYFLMSGGAPATIKTIRENLDALPPHIKPHFKHYQLITFEHKIIGVIDYVESYPDCNTVHIGLLLIHKDFQGSGHGKEFMKIFQEQIHKKGYKRIRLGVLKENDFAFHFWHNLGFSFLKEVSSPIHTQKNWTLLLMEKRI